MMQKWFRAIGSSLVLAFLAACSGESEIFDAPEESSGNIVVSPQPSPQPESPSATATPSPMPPQMGQTQPYLGVPFAVPGEIEAEDYDINGFFDVDENNTGMAYRSDAVDIQAASEGGFNIGWIRQGEWWHYSIDVGSTGVYRIEAKVSALNTAGAVQLSLNGEVLSESAMLPITGGWQSWVWVDLGVYALAQGQHRLTVQAIDAGFNFNTLRLSAFRPTNPSPAPASPSPTPGPGTPAVTPAPSAVPSPSPTPVVPPAPTPTSQPSPIPTSQPSPTPTSQPSPTPNALPVVRFTAPLNGATVAHGSPLAVTVTATDADGSIANVRLSLDGQFLRQENAAPYEWGMGNAADAPLASLAAGQHTLSAVATDNLGATTSVTIRITVQQATPTPSPTAIPSPSPTAAPSPTPTVPPVANFDRLYLDQCATCHGDFGEGRPTLVGCPSCNNIAEMTRIIADTMPLADPSACVGDCAVALASKIKNEFNGGSTDNQKFEFSAFEILDWGDTLRKATLNLAGRLPTAAETSQVNMSGESGFTAALDNVMRENNFYARLREIFNDRWFVRKYLGGTNALRELPSATFPNRYWYDNQGYDDATARRMRDLSNTAVAEDNLRLVEFIARNNRPATEIVTANYIVVNPFSARSYGVFDSVTFTDVNNADEWRMARVANYPHAGVLTSPVFLARYPTTATNKNRHRSYIAYLYFLDTDILASADRPLTTGSESGTNPTLNDPNCNVCHNTIDPVAQLFSNFQRGTLYDPARRQFADLLDAGIGSTLMPDAQDDTRLQWFGSMIAADARFARAMVRTLYKPITGYDFLPAPADGNAKALAAYNAQRQVIRGIEQRFISGNYNIKSLIHDIVKSAYFRVDGLLAGYDAELYADSATVHMLTPEQLHRKLQATTGRAWRVGNNDVLLRNTYYYDIYGGINSNDVTERNFDPNGLVVSVQARLANQHSCHSVAKDFVLTKSERTLFPLVELSTVSRDSGGNIIAANEALIEDNILHLQRQLLGREDAELADTLRDVFFAVQARGLQLIAADSTHRNLSTECRVTTHPLTGASLATADRITTDDNYSVRSWMAVLRVILNDYSYLYE